MSISKLFTIAIYLLLDTVVKYDENPNKSYRSIFSIRKYNIMKGHGKISKRL